jgi:hypothetical protein
MRDERVRSRARHPLPEEQAAGTDDPEGQAAAVLGESDERQLDPEPVEERTSEDVTDPP